MSELSNSSANRFDIFLADSLHQSFDFLLSISSEAYELRVNEVRLVLPATIQSIPDVVRIQFDH